MPKFNPAADYGSNKPREQKSFHIPPGTYKVKVEAVELRQPRDPSKPEYFNVRMRVSQGQFNGSTIWDVISTGPRSFWKLGSFCKAFGFADVIGDIDLPQQADIIIVKAADRFGWVETRIEEMSNKKLKTQIAKYIEKEDEEEAEEAPASTDDVFDNSPADFEDDIPF